VRLLMSIPSLAAGGAERQFAALARGLAEAGHEVLAVTLGRGGALAAELGPARLVELGKSSRLDSPRVALALAGLLRRQAAQIHYAFLPSCCVLGALLQPFCPGAQLVFGVRAAMDPEDAPGLAGPLLLRAQARLSRWAALVIANSEAGRQRCLDQGFAPARLCVVQNGVDTASFRPDKALGADLRARWGVAPGDKLIGLVARLDPLKDHAVFLEAAALLAARRPDVRFVCVGGGAEEYAVALRERAARLGLGGRLTWAGEQADMPAVYNALDLVCLSSRREGFPNVLAEALACGVPGVTTAAGDAPLLLGDCGLAVASGDSDGLAAGLAAVLERLEREGAALNAACRSRAETQFFLSRLVAATEALLLETLRAG